MGCDGPVGTPGGPLASGQCTAAPSDTGTGVVAPTWPPTVGWQPLPCAPPGPPLAWAAGVSRTVTSPAPTSAANRDESLRRIAGAVQITTGRAPFTRTKRPGPAGRVGRRTAESTG